MVNAFVLLSLCAAFAAGESSARGATKNHAFDRNEALAAWTLSGDVAVDVKKGREGSGGSLKVAPGGTALLTAPPANGKVVPSTTPSSEPGLRYKPDGKEGPTCEGCDSLDRCPARLNRGGDGYVIQVDLLARRNNCSSDSCAGTSRFV